MPTAEMCREMELLFEQVRAQGKRAGEDQLRWDRDFLAMAEWFALRKSKDPSTKCCGIITRGREFVSMGYNGFAKGVGDSPERYADRERKLRRVVHAEINAIVFARQNLEGCTLYTWPFMPCSNCAGVVINAGIKRVVAPETPAEKRQRWAENMADAAEQFAEAGVELVIL